MVAEHDLADHIDLNFGCPVPKVTRRGGGAALPYKRRLFERIVRAAVDNAGRPPGDGQDADRDRRRAPHLPRRRRAGPPTPGVAAVALHARTAAQRYSGTADWSAIARLRDALPAELPVLGNGDIFSAADALAMVRADRMRRGGDRPRLPGAAVAVRRPGGGVRRAPAARPRRRSARSARPCAGTPQLLSQHMGADKGIRDMRKHIAWYLKGFPVGPELRRRLGLVEQPRRARRTARPARPRRSPSRPTPTGPRGRQGSPGRVVLPEGWLDDPDDPRCRSAPSSSTPAAEPAPLAHRRRSHESITVGSVGRRSGGRPARTGRAGSRGSAPSVDLRGDGR